MSAIVNMTPERRAAAMVRDSGYKGGGEVKIARRAAVKVVRKAIAEHDKSMHGGKHETLKLKRGGKVEGGESECRPDRRARGGAMHGKGKIGTVNIHVGNTPEALQAEQQGRQQGAAVGAKLASIAPHPPAIPPMGGAPPPRPPMPPPGGAPMGAGPPGMGGPPGGMPMRPPGVKRGGGIHARAKGGDVPANIERRDGSEYEPAGQATDKSKAFKYNGKSFDSGVAADAASGRANVSNMPSIYEPPNEPAEVLNMARRRGGGVPKDLEMHSGTEYEPPDDEHVDRKRGGGVPKNLERHSGTEFEPPAKRRGGKC